MYIQVNSFNSLLTAQMESSQKKLQDFLFL